MKFLMLADVFFPDTTGGAGRVVYHLSRELTGRGNEVHVVTRSNEHRFPLSGDLGSRFFVHRFGLPRQESAAFFISEAKNSNALIRNLIRENRFDCICPHQSLVTVGPLFFRTLQNAPMIYTFHSPWHEEFITKKKGTSTDVSMKTKLVALVMRRIEKKVLSKASRIVVLSQYMKEKVMEIHRCPERNIIHIPGGVDLGRFHPPHDSKDSIKGKLGLPPDKTIFLTVRNLVHRMGIETLITAFDQSQMLQENSLCLIGGDGPLKEQLETRIEHCRLGHCVRLLGYVPEALLPKYYQAADFFVLPTGQLEGFGLVILEALACGTPVLGTPVGAIPEIINRFDGRLVFNGRNAGDIGQKLEDVLSHPETYHHDASRCRRFVENHFSWEKAADQFAGAVLELTGK
ncbi:MAG: glycosyltransferase family 4 protein [Deltaproteobacteria bacterium]|nr:glycosyltransferase family 4 protein [Deltaproteobacteria bacterium]